MARVRGVPPGSGWGNRVSKSASSRPNAKNAPGRNKGAPARAGVSASPADAAPKRASRAKTKADSAKKANAKAKTKAKAKPKKSAAPRRPRKPRVVLPPPKSFLQEEGAAIVMLVAPVLVLTLAVLATQWITPSDAARRQFALLPDAQTIAAAGPSAQAVAVPPAPSHRMRLAVAPPSGTLATAQPRVIGLSAVFVAASALPPSTRLGQTAPESMVVARLARPGRASKCVAPPVLAASSPQSRPIQSVPPQAFGRLLARAAFEQTRDLVVYTDRYRQIGFPMGDVPDFYGVCTDVVVRAYRSLGIDLQVLVHKARIGTGDTSIDHRRTGTLRRFFARYGVSLPVTDFADDYRPGDIVTYHRASGRTSQSHIAIVADVIAPSGRPMIVHNRGWGPQLEDALFASNVTGHFRYMPDTGTVTGPNAGGRDTAGRGGVTSSKQVAAQSVSTGKDRSASDSASP
jgi:uncharacterized protein